MTRRIGLCSKRFSTKLPALLVASWAAIMGSGCASPTEYDIIGGDGGTGSGNAPGLGGASNAGAPPAAGASSAGAGNASSGGGSAAGAPATGGGSSSAGAPSAGSGSGGNGAAGAPSAGGSAGQGSAGSSAAGSSNAGSTGGTGCSAPAWANGTTYKVGDVVTATCNAPGGGSAVCTSGKKYVWTCMGTGCTAFGAGADAWWANWTLGATCN